MKQQLDVEYLPDEVVEFASDQYTDKVTMFPPESIELVLNESVQIDCNDSEVEIHQTVAEEVIHSLFQEKLQDMLWEVEKGERSDYSVAEIEQWLNRIHDQF